MSQRLDLLKRLQEVHLSPEEAQALMQRVNTHIDSAQDRDLLAQIIGSTLAVRKQLLEASSEPASPVSVRPSSEHNAKRKRQAAKASRRRNRR